MACTTLALSRTVGALDYDYISYAKDNESYACHITVNKLSY